MDFLYTGHLVFILILVGSTHYLGVKKPKSVFFSRKILHIGAISAVAHATFITTQNQLPMFSVLILAAAVLLTIAVLKGFFEIDGRKSWGIAYFPWVLFLMLQCQPERTEIIALSFAVLAVSDGLSALAGRYIQLPQKLRLKNASINGKTWVGFAVFLVSACLVLMVFFHTPMLEKNDDFSLNTAWLSLFIIALTTAMVELISINGTDNIWLPLWVFFLLVWIGRLGFLVALFANYIPILAIIAFAVWRKKWLSLDGLFTALLLALTLILFQINLTPLVLFFLLGSVASKLNKKIQSDQKHGKPRDKWQVLANGGILVLLPIANAFWGNPLMKEEVDFVVVAVMAAALGDTLSSEIGMRWGKSPFRLTSRKPIPAGVSGGVTLAGLIGALIGGTVMAAYFMWGVEWDANSMVLVLFIVFSGLGGSLLDSLLGDLFQAKYQKGGVLSDEGASEELVGGLKYFNNDAINAMSLTVWMCLSVAFVYTCLFFWYQL